MYCFVQCVYITGRQFVGLRLPLLNSYCITINDQIRAVPASKCFVYASSCPGFSGPETKKVQYSVERVKKTKVMLSLAFYTAMYG